ncbi:hypothetical protein TcG_00223 [Trypanosoma cruzi]|nr:hypothetical protein TcG_00223 [Trypanosoma cruzi]
MFAGAMAFDAGIMEGALFPLHAISVDLWCWLPSATLPPFCVRWRLLCGCAPAFCVAVTRAALQHRLFTVLLWVLCMVPTCGRFCVGGASKRRWRPAEGGDGESNE